MLIIISFFLSLSLPPFLNLSPYSSLPPSLPLSLSPSSSIPPSLPLSLSPSSSLLSLPPSLPPSLPLPQGKQEASEERKFIKGLKDKQEAEMKQFVNQQKAELRATKSLYKRRLEDNGELNSGQKKTILDERKKELISQQKANEERRLQMLKTARQQELVEFRQKALQDRHSFEKGLLQEVCVCMCVSVCRCICVCVHIHVHVCAVFHKCIHVHVHCIIQNVTLTCTCMYAYSFLSLTFSLSSVSPSLSPFSLSPSLSPTPPPPKGTQSDASTQGPGPRDEKTPSCQHDRATVPAAAVTA